MAANERPRMTTRGRPGLGNRPVDAPLPHNPPQPRSSHALAVPSQQQDLPAWMIQQQQQQQNVSQQAELQRVKIRYQASLLPPQASATTNQQLLNTQGQQIFDPDHSHTMKPGTAFVQVRAFAQGQSTLADTFSQGSYLTELDPVGLLQYANRENSKAHRVSQSMRNAGSAQTYPDPEQFSAIGHQIQQQNIANGQPYHQQHNTSNQRQQVHRDVTHLLSPDRRNQVRNASPNILAQHPDPTLDPRLFHSTVAQSGSQGRPNQSQHVQIQGPHRQNNPSRGQPLPSHQLYNSDPGGRAEYLTTQQHQHESNINNLFRRAQNAVDLDNTFGWNHNTVYGNTMALGKAPSRPDVARPHGTSEAYGNRWLPTSNNTTDNKENLHQVPQTSVSPAETITAKPSLVHTTQSLLSRETVVTEPDIGLIPVSPPSRPKRRASQLSKDSGPGTTKDKKQKTTPSQAEKIPRPPMNIPAPVVTKDPMEFQFTGQRSGGAFRRTFAAQNSSKVSNDKATEIVEASKPQVALEPQNTAPTGVPLKKPETVTVHTYQKVNAPATVPPAKNGEPPAATKPQQHFSPRNTPQAYIASGNGSRDQHRPQPNSQPQPPRYHSPYTQSLQYVSQQGSHPSPYSYNLSQHMPPVGATNFPPSRPTSPQPPPQQVHPDRITKTWHPQPCGCCQNGVPGRLIREGNAFRNFDRIEIEESEARIAAWKSFRATMAPSVEDRLSRILQ